MLPSVKFAEDKVLTFLILREKCLNSANLSLTEILTLISRADWSDKSERYRRTLHCFQNISFNKRTHPNEYRNGHQLSTKWALARPVALGSYQSSAAGRCAGKGCAL